MKTFRFEAIRPVGSKQAYQPISKREQKRLEAAEHVCRAFRKGISYYATQEIYFCMALDWLNVWIDNAPKRVTRLDPISPKKKRRA